MNATDAKSKYKGEQVIQPVKHWHIRSAVLAVAVLAGGVSISAQALVLGHIRINSALGEPIKAEIPVTKITSDESSSLKINLADANDFTGHGLLYNAAIAAMRVDFKMTGNNTGVISISGMKPVQDPFVDLLLDVRWRTGGMQRSYTMLFDPPEHIVDNAVYSSSSAPQVSILESSQGGTAPQGESLQVSITESSNDVAVNRERLPDGTLHERIGPSRPVESAEPRVKGADTPNRSGGQRAQKSPKSGNDGASYRVNVGKGQTLGQIAASMKPAGVSQDQMLAALFRANPNAFINQNINLLRAGVSLTIPSDSDIAAIGKGEARNLVRSHNRQFNEYRTQLAGGARRATPKNQNSTTVQTAGGTVDTAAPVNTPKTGKPELVITPETPQQQGTDQATAATMQADGMNQHIGDSRAAQGEIQEIANEINQTGGGSIPVSEPPSVPDAQNAPTPSEGDMSNGASSATDTAPVEAPLVVDQGGAETSAAPAAGAQDSAAAASTNDKASQQEAPKPEPKPQAAGPNIPPAAGEESLVEMMLKKPWIPVAGLAALILVILGAVKLLRRRKKDDFSDDTGDLESTNDSFFTDTQESSMMDQSSSIYAASQLDTNADVDPLQEADVYLAYGRDEQAAEILRDAIQADPSRAALHAKLCEIYAKQGNTNRFESQRSELRVLTGGQGPDWDRVEKIKSEMNSSSATENAVPEVAAPTSSGIAANFAPPAQPAAAPESNSFQAASSNPSNDLPDLEITNDTFNALQSTPQTIDFTDPASEIPDEEEGPITRLALAEEFLAIGNKLDAKEIAQEVLAENIPADLKERAQSLLNKAS